MPARQWHALFCSSLVCAACRYADAVPEAIPVHKQLLDVMNGNVEYDASSCRPSSHLPSKSLDEHARGLAPQFLQALAPDTVLRQTFLFMR
jgi:hypothetical protein